MILGLKEMSVLFEMIDSEIVKIISDFETFFKSEISNNNVYILLIVRKRFILRGKGLSKFI